MIRFRFGVYDSMRRRNSYAGSTAELAMVQQHFYYLRAVTTQRSNG